MQVSFHCKHPYLYNTAVAVELLSIRIDVTFQDEALYFLAISAMAFSRTVGDADTDEDGYIYLNKVFTRAALR
ncbi:hypothetical protein EIMP300_76770 [Escherichia coli]|uniref:Uncharacterized protein n=1 Tax=Escherichia coli TaxID=562 RepID=A0A8S0G2G5_ECOLX|nr:hypothetical protein EIMP300_76770 [Escherichia coli]